MIAYRYERDRLALFGDLQTRETCRGRRPKEHFYLRALLGRSQRLGREGHDIAPDALYTCDAIRAAHVQLVLLREQQVDPVETANGVLGPGGLQIVHM